MTMTTRVQSVSIPVADQDRALAFYTEVLGCELRTDIEVWPGAGLVEVVPPRVDRRPRAAAPGQRDPDGRTAGHEQRRDRPRAASPGGREAAQRRGRAP